METNEAGQNQIGQKEIGQRAPMNFYCDFRSRIHIRAKEKGKVYEYLEYLLLAPDFIYLLGCLMFEKRVSWRAKGKVGIFIVYYLSPIEIIPEALLGPVGFADDLVLAVWTINSLLRSVDRNVLIENWPSELNLFQALEKVLKFADNYLGKSAYQKLKAFFTGKIGK